jgi:RNA polymerase sigma-70 factor (ECF subfamily)
VVKVADFAAIVHEHQGMVFSIAYHFLHDRALAEEVSQETFLQLHKHLASLESPAHVLYWLRRATSNRCIDYARHQRLAPQIALESVPEPAALDTPGDPMLARRLRQLVASLPPKQRMVVVLRYQEELEPEEIAKLLNMPVGTVKSQLQRSLAVLREKVTRTMGMVNL